MKEILEWIAVLFGGCILTLCGGFDIALQTLLIFMCIDYITGIFVAGIFHKSKKSTHGSLSSVAGWKGITKKISTIFLIVVSNHLDKVIGVHYVRNAAVIGFIINEGISILENYSLMGGTGADVLQKALDVLKTKREKF